MPAADIASVSSLRKSGGDVTQVNGWECGRTVPSEQSLTMLAEALDIDVRLLTDDDGAVVEEVDAPAGNGGTVNALIAQLADVIGVPVQRLKLTIDYSAA